MDRYVVALVREAQGVHLCLTAMQEREHPFWELRYGFSSTGPTQPPFLRVRARRRREILGIALCRRKQSQRGRISRSNRMARCDIVRNVKPENPIAPTTVRLAELAY